MTAMEWSPPAAMAVTRAGGRSRAGSRLAMACGKGMDSGCGLGPCIMATSCAWPSWPREASPQVKILPSAASATLCARPAATDTMRS